MKDWGMPGPGGSLGECAVCGEGFIVECLMGTLVRAFTVDGIDWQLWGHSKCIEAVKEITDGNWSKLPDGPLRQAFARHHKQGVTP